jgi:hypothetical protein
MLVFSGCIQPRVWLYVKEKMVSDEWRPDGVAGMNEYSNSMVLHGARSQGYSGVDLEVSWKIDDQYLYMALNRSTNGWISVGFEPSEWMKDADIIMRSVVDGKPVVLDEYSTGNYGPHSERLNWGARTIFWSSGRMEKGGFTVVEFKRKLNTGDVDKPFAPGQEISMIWALADSADFQFKHNIAKGEAVLVLQANGQKSTNSSSLIPAGAGGILFIAEEEKIARDLYRSFYGTNQTPIFQELAQSELNHMDSVKPLIEKYGGSPIME